MVDERTAVQRRGAAVIRDGVPHAEADTTLSLMAAAAIGEWLAANRDAFHGDLLDLGCGNAPYREWYLPMVDKAIAYDPAYLPNVDVNGFAENMPFPDQSFDVILASEVFEHVDDAEAAMAEVRRVLKPSGCVLLTVPFIYPVHEEPHDHRRFTNFGLAGLVERHGLTVVDVKAKGGVGVMVGHWLVMLAWVAMRGTARKLRNQPTGVPSEPQAPSRPSLLQRLLRFVMTAPQRPVVARGVCCDVSGTAAWATLGYMLRAELPSC